MMATGAHASWPVCVTCNGLGEENERGHYVEKQQIIDENGVPVTSMIRVWKPHAAPNPGAYAGPCRACDGLGRTQPADWREPLFDTNGALLDPGTVPELQALGAFKRGDHHHGTT